MFYYSYELKKLCNKVSKSLGVYSLYLDIGRYNDGEIYLDLPLSFYNKNVFIFKNIYKPINSSLVEVLFVVNYFKSNFAKSVSLVSPYLGYSRQDKIEGKNCFIPSKFISKLFKNSGLDRLITVDIHSQQVISYYDIPVINIKTNSLISKIIRKYRLLSIFPDYGSYNRFICKNIKNYIVLSKYRNKEKISYKTLKRIKGNRAIIIDDIINTGSTISNLCKHLIFKKLYLYSTHVLFNGSFVKILPKLKPNRIFVTNTIERCYDKPIHKLDISSLLANTIAPLI
ncbi:ribose-phosphate pyrophosphokinase [Candidatus Vidania fulgoroideae]|uniref:Ribose-phosphate pyrophosphokinase n=1 Tax=Candidatus Vidania fulgoroideorum TaxID=881286 RepID=A0A974XAI1_9PROT|nr:ribose-phosphate pyrophosphokinase [Candidatus Vidania fulgoroideae]